MSAVERIERRTDIRDLGYLTPCKVFTGYLLSNGYGRVMVGSQREGTRRLMLAHRAFWEHHHGPIPDGMQIDHLCHDASCSAGRECPHRACVEITHLALRTQRENVQRGFNFWRARTHCKHGHPFDSANTLIRSSDGARCCRTCGRARNQAHRDRKQAAA
jgi:hypothetical protein